MKVLLYGSICNCVRMRVRICASVCFTVLACVNEHECVREVQNVFEVYAYMNMNAYKCTCVIFMYIYAYIYYKHAPFQLHNTQATHPPSVWCPDKECKGAFGPSILLVLTGISDLCLLVFSLYPMIGRW